MPVPMACCEKQLHCEHKGKYAEKKGEGRLKRRQRKITEIRSQENSLKKGKEKEPIKIKGLGLSLSICPKTSSKAC